MTGELADCFPDAATGVRQIVAATETAVAAQHGDPPPTAYYAVDGCFRSAAQASACPDLLAASNWHALAQLVASQIDRETLLIDIGSTTTDLTRLFPGRVATSSQHDFDRLVNRELVYQGIGRTPLCAVVDALPVDDQTVPVMKEVFATTDDCALLTGMIGEETDDRQTADGRPRTRDAARGRMAKMVGLDHRRFGNRQAVLAAEACVQRLTSTLLAAAQQVAPAAQQWIAGGHGAVMLRHPAVRDQVSPQAPPLLDLAELLPAFVLETSAPAPRQAASATSASALSRVAPAFAVAYLRAAAERGTG